MATVTGLTADRMLAIEAASVVSGEIDDDGHLILTTHGGDEIDAGSALPALPISDDTTQGIVELATDAEAITGSDTTRAVTPHALTAAVGSLVPAATTSVAGKVELATDAEAIAGSDTTRAVTPHALAATVAAATAPDATTTLKGIVELATTTEATTGTDSTRAVTPDGLKAAIDALKQLIWPVGCYYTSDSVSTSPATILGFGTWSAVQAKVLIGADGATYTAGSTGGSETHTLATGNLPAHHHNISLTSGAGGAHSHGAGANNAANSGSGSFAFHNPIGTNGTAGALTIPGVGDHTHAVSGDTADTGSGTAVNHMNPWRAVYMWRRTA